MSKLSKGKNNKKKSSKHQNKKDDKPQQKSKQTIQKPLPQLDFSQSFKQIISNNSKGWIGLKQMNEIVVEKIQIMDDFITLFGTVCFFLFSFTKHLI